ncbi:MAG TPA: M23 family metallopeptidase [Xanthobacteraceae bacterium]|nr:M23 family metallopeptidase [Xanthobacteraceae bacterium]
MDQGRLRGAHHRAGHEPDPVDFGNEPPLSVDGEDTVFVDRRRVSVHWFTGTILTGFCGAALMGGAVFASLDGETNFATVPERVELALRGAVNSVGESLGVRKSDKLPAPSEASFTRQVLHDSTITQIGNREVVRARSLIRVAGNLALTATELSANIPPFNPQRMLAESASGGADTAETPPEAEPDAEVSFVMRDLAPGLGRARIAAVTPVDELVMRVREVANWRSGTRQSDIASVQGRLKLAYAVEGNPGPYANLEPRIIPENVTLLPKTRTQATGGNAWNERTIVLKKGDTLESVLGELGATADEIKGIVIAFGRRPGQTFKEGEKLRVLLSPVAGTQRLQPVRVIVASDSAIEAMVALSDMDKYVPVGTDDMTTEVAQADEQPDDGAGVRLYQSLYETGLRNRLPRPVIDNLVRLYSYDFDFQRKVQPGDSFEVLFAGQDENRAEENPDVLFTSISVGGEMRRYYRFRTPDDGVVDYYDETGKSAEKFLVRKPVADGIMRSGFGLREHPILGVSKMHTGVDWAAPSGTPIFAAGNGVVEKAQWEGGYGKFVLLRHNNGYETAYGHMTAFARGIEPGVTVHQGQVIGFVGSTGLSTGTHVHYEIRINDRFVDPMRIKLPRGRVLEGPLLAAFEKEREHLDGLMARSPARLAQSAY